MIAGMHFPWCRRNYVRSPSIMTVSEPVETVRLRKNPKFGNLDTHIKTSITKFVVLYLLLRSETHGIKVSLYYIISNLRSLALNLVELIDNGYQKHRFWSQYTTSDTWVNGRILMTIIII